MGSAVCRDKIEGMFLGVAIGDALGAPVKMKSLEEIVKKYGRVEEYYDPIENPLLRWQRTAGMWSEATQLTLVVAESLIALGKIDMDDLTERHVIAMMETDVGWGRSTLNAVERLRDGASWRDSGMPIKFGDGMDTGVAMKLSPIAAYIAAHYERTLPSRLSIYDLVEQLKSFTCMTHRTRMAFSSTFAHATALYYCLVTGKGFSRQVFHNRIGRVSPIGDLAILDPGGFETDRFPDRIKQIAQEDWTKKSAKEISDAFGHGSGYVYNSLPFCYAFFLKAPDSIETLYETISAGGDADTNGSIVGGMLGALNGKNIFPKHLVDGLWQKDRIFEIARKFCEKFNILG